MPATFTTEAYVIDATDNNIRLHITKQHAVDILRAHKMINHNNVTCIKTMSDFTDCINCDVDVTLKIQEFDFVSKIPQSFGKRIQGKSLKILSLIKKE